MEVEVKVGNMSREDKEQTHLFFKADFMMPCVPSTAGSISSSGVAASM